MLNTFTKRLVVLLVAMMAIDETKAQLLAEFAQVPDRYTISREPSLPEVLRKLESIYKVSIAYPSDLADQDRKSVV